MIPRILFAAAAMASFPLILNPAPASAAIGAPSNVTQMGHISIGSLTNASVKVYALKVICDLRDRNRTGFSNNSSKLLVLNLVK